MKYSVSYSVGFLNFG